MGHPVVACLDKKNRFRYLKNWKNSSDQHFRTCAPVRTCLYPSARVYVRKFWIFLCDGAVRCGNSKNMSRTHTMNLLKIYQKKPKKFF